MSGAGMAILVVTAINMWFRRQRAQALQEEDETEEATATILGKEHYTTRSTEWSTRDHYKVTYEFTAEKADGTPCQVQVFGREIDSQTYDRLLEGKTAQVLYLTGRPASCRLKDCVEKEGGVGGMVMIGVMSACFIVSLCFIFGEFWSIPEATTVDPEESNQIRYGAVLFFFLSFCGCSALGGGYQYQNRNNDNVHGGQVDVNDLPESDSDNDVLLDNA